MHNHEPRTTKHHAKNQIILRIRATSRGAMSRDTCHASDHRHGHVTSTHITICEAGGVLFSSQEGRASGVTDSETLTRFPPIHSETWHLRLAQPDIQPLALDAGHRCPLDNVFPRRGCRPILAAWGAYWDWPGAGYAGRPSLRHEPASAPHDAGSPSATGYACGTGPGPWLD